MPPCRQEDKAQACLFWEEGEVFIGSRSKHCGASIDAVSNPRTEQDADAEVLHR